MAINVKHGTSAGSVAAAAFAGAQGQAMRRAGGRPVELGGGRPGRRSAADEHEELIAQQRQQQQAAAPGEQGFYGGAGFTLGPDGKALQWGPDGRPIMPLGADFKPLAFRAGARAQAGLPDMTPEERSLRLKQRIEADGLELSLSARQKAELHQLAEAEAQAMQSSDFTDEEKAELRYRFAQKRAGITPVARPKQPTASELFKQRTHVDPRTGAIFPLDEKGNPGKPIYEPPEKIPTVQDRVKAFETAVSFLSGPDGKGDVNLTDVKFRQAMRFMLGEAGLGVPGHQSGQAQSPNDPATNAALDAIWGSMRGDQSFAPGAAPAEAAPQDEVSAELAKITGSVPNELPIDPEEVNDLATAGFQLEAARKALGEIQGGYESGRAAEARAKAYKVAGRQDYADREMNQAFGHNMSAAEKDLERRGFLGLGQRRGEYLRERVKALEERQRALRLKADMLEARRVLRAARSAPPVAEPPPVAGLPAEPPATYAMPGVPFPPQAAPRQGPRVAMPAWEPSDPAMKRFFLDQLEKLKGQPDLQKRFRASFRATYEQAQAGGRLGR